MMMMSIISIPVSMTLYVLHTPLPFGNEFPQVVTAPNPDTDPCFQQTCQLN